MRRNGVLLSRDAARRAQVLAEIGRRLREQYDLAQPLPDRLVEIIRKIEQSGSLAAVESKPGG